MNLNLLKQKKKDFIISPLFCYLAAHCFDEIKIKDLSNSSVLRSLVNVRFGEWKTDSNPDCEHGVDDQYCKEFVEIPPYKLIIHDNYKTSRATNKYKNDIAILKMEWPPKPSKIISSINLPSENDCTISKEDDLWTVTGFGMIIFI